MTESTPKKKVAPTATSTASKFSLPKFDIPKFDLPKVDVPNFDIPKVALPSFDLPKVDLPKFDVPKFDLPKVTVPEQVTSLADRGANFVQDSVKSAHETADSVRRNVSQTVVLVREVVGI
jgi:hypothetical protein